MVHSVKYYFLLLFFFVTACNELDFTGLIYVEPNVNERFKQSMEWNNVNPPRKVSVYGPTYSFLICSDTHIGGVINITGFLNKADEHDFSVVIGDVTTGNREDYEIAFDLFSNVPEKPCFLTAGNHDLYFRGWESYLEFFGSSTYTVDVETTEGDDLLIFLETGSATLGTLQMNWLKDLLEKERPHYRNCFVFSHVNFKKFGLDLATSMITEDCAMLFDLFYKHNVDYVFQGHPHARNVEILGHTTYLILDALVDGNSMPVTYVHFINDRGNCSFEFIEL